MADDDPVRRWEEVADSLGWRRRFDTVQEPGERGGRWFAGGTLNVSEICLDRHLPELADRVAFYWEGEPGDQRVVTYADLHREVTGFAAGLRRLGVGSGDRVAIYTGFLPETVVAMLACARIGATHALLASALPADALADRLADLDPKVLITQDGSWRHGVVLPLKARADEAVAAATGIEHTIVVRRAGIDVGWYEGDLWFDDVRADPDTTEPEAFPAEHPLAVAYIANRRGRPTGIVHASGGLIVYAAELHRNGLVAGVSGVYWCAVEPAWLAGQTHGVYGPLACGATSVVYEGMLDTPSHDRTWAVIERYQVASLMTTPSVVRNLHRWADSPPLRERLASLGRIVTGGESIDQELRSWLMSEVAGPETVVADAWGQTELGGIVRLLDEGRDTLPDAGLDVVDGAGASLPVGERGELVVCVGPGPACSSASGTTTAERRRTGIAFRGCTRPATGCVARSDGSLSLLGRIDPVVSISAQLVSLAEVRGALLEHPYVADAEIVEQIDRQAGPSITACVVLADSLTAGDGLARVLREHVRERVGGLAQPRLVAFVDAFPADVDEETRRLALRMLCATAPADEAHFSVTELRAAASSVPSA